MGPIMRTLHIRDLSRQWNRLDLSSPECYTPLMASAYRALQEFEYLLSLADAAQMVVDIIEDDQIEIGSPVWDEAFNRLKEILDAR